MWMFPLFSAFVQLLPTNMSKRFCKTIKISLKEQCKMYGITSYTTANSLIWLLFQYSNNTTKTAHNMLSIINFQLVFRGPAFSLATIENACNKGGVSWQVLEGADPTGSTSGVSTCWKRKCFDRIYYLQTSQDISWLSGSQHIKDVIL